MRCIQRKDTRVKTYDHEGGDKLFDTKNGPEMQDNTQSYMFLSYFGRSRIIKPVNVQSIFAMKKLIVALSVLFLCLHA